MDTTMQTTTPDPGVLPVPDEASTARLQALLDAELAFDPVARGGFINHLSMSLVAAWRIGAGADELDTWFRAQTEDDFLVPRSRPTWLDDDTHRIEQRGVEAEVRERLPALVGSPGSQFFHAIIRLEHAVDSGHAGQVASALRNWEDHAEVRPERSTDDDARSAAEVLDDTADAAVRTYLASPDIGTLHLVTGTRAARALEPLLDEPATRLLALATSRAVDARSGPGDPGLAADRPGGEVDLPDWVAIARAALDSYDPHVVKLVHSCEWEYLCAGDPLHRRAAAVATGLAR